MNDKPKRCIDAVLKCCDRCPYGVITYPDFVATYEDLNDCCYYTSCVFGFENDKPTPKELEEFNHYKKNKGWCFNG